MGVRVFEREDPVPAVGRRHWALFVSGFQVDAFAYELGISPEVVGVHLPLDLFSGGQGGRDYVFRIEPGFGELVGPELYVIGYCVYACDGYLARDGGAGVKEVFGEIVYLSNLFFLCDAEASRCDP